MPANGVGAWNTIPTRRRSAERVHRGHVLAAEPHRTPVRDLEPVAQPEQARLPRTRRTDDDRHAVRRDLPGDVDEPVPTVGSGETGVVEREERARRDARIMSPRDRRPHEALEPR